MKRRSVWFLCLLFCSPPALTRAGVLERDDLGTKAKWRIVVDKVMQPEADYEIDGFYRGVCFPCGAVVIDGTLFVYYGGGDKVCAVATCEFERLLDYLCRCPG